MTQNREQSNAYAREWYRSHSKIEKERRRKRRLRNKESGKTAKWARVTAAKRKKEIYVMSTANRALRFGKIERKPCSREDNNCSGRMEMHHEDYDKPLDVIWFCQFHHGQRHRELNDLKRLQANE